MFKTRRGKIGLIILGVIIFLFTAIFLFFKPSSKNLEVVFIDVGQGDSILIKSPYGQNILIDGGPDNKVLAGLGANISWYDRKIDLVILTHPHDDHVNGLIEVLKRYDVPKLLYTGVEHTAPNYFKLIKTAKEAETVLMIVDKKQNILLGDDCKLEIIYPDKSFLDEKSKNLNNTSIISKLDCLGKEFLFMGDAEKEIEKELLGKDFDLVVDVLKVGHHGSDTSSIPDFLKEVNPKFAVIQVGEDNKFGHPAKSVLMNLEKLGIKTFRMDIDGTTNFFVDESGLLSIK